MNMIYLINSYQLTAYLNPKANSHAIYILLHYNTIECRSIFNNLLLLIVCSK